MKGLKKLALATAVAAAPFAQAEMTAMDDALLGEMTGQAGLTLDINLDMTIAEVRYADEDGADATSASDAGFLTFSNVHIYGDQGNGTQAEIRGVTIDVDGDDGLVIGFGQIGNESNAVAAAATDAALAAEVAASNYWTGVNVDVDFGINGDAAGSFEIKNFTNFVPNALAMEAVLKFGYELVDNTGAYLPGAAGTGVKVQLTNDNATQDNLTAISSAFAPTGLIAQEAANIGPAMLAGGANAEQVASQAKLNVLTSTDAVTAAGGGSNGLAAALTAGAYVDAHVDITAGGGFDGANVADANAEGLTINATVGFVIEEMSYVDDTNKFGVHNFTMYDTTADGVITGFTVTGLQINVVDHTSAITNVANEALKISGLNTSGTIAMGDIFVGDHNSGSLGALAIRDINMSNTEVYIYGH